MKNIFLLAAILTTPTAFSCTIEKLARQNMQTVEWEEEEWPHESFYDYLRRALEYQECPQQAKRRRMVFQIFKQRKEQFAAQSGVVCDSTTWRDLMLFVGKECGSPYIGDIVRRTQTEIGFVYVLTMLAQPLNDVTKLRNRQTIIKQLVDNPELLYKLKHSLECIAEAEPYILSFFANDPLRNTAEKQHYFDTPIAAINTFGNHNQWTLTGLSCVRHTRRIIETGSNITASVILPLCLLAKLMHSTMPKKIEQYAQSFIGLGGAENILLSLTNNRYVSTGAMLYAAYYAACSIKKSLAWTCDNFFLDWCLQKKLHNIGRMFGAAEDICSQITNNPALTAMSLTRIVDLEKVLDPFFGSHDAQELRALLQSSTFIEQPSYFSLHGRILRAYHCMMACKEEYIDLLLALGEIDAYCSIASLILEFKHQRVNYCFAEWVESSVPVLFLENFWNPCISPDRVVPNSLAISSEDAHTLIITGPNAGGKSAVIKGVGCALILAQSFGIVPAHSAIISPFDQIVTYLNITDDISEGNSLFKAQILRVQHIVDQASLCNSQGKKIFIALDEMFNGTSPREALACAYSVAHYLGQLDMALTLIATHYPELTKLEVNPFRFKNFKVSVDRASNGRIHYPFILEPGISQQHIAIDLLQQEGIDGNVIAMAQKIDALHL